MGVFKSIGRILTGKATSKDWKLAGKGVGTAAAIAVGGYYLAGMAGTSAAAGAAGSASAAGTGSLSAAGYGAASVGAATAATSSLSTAGYLLAGAYVGNQVYANIQAQKAQNEANRIAAQGITLQQNELARQRQIEMDRQRRENLELMNAVSGLSNTGWNTVGSRESYGFDKYGDLG